MDFSALLDFFSDPLLSVERRALALVYGDPVSARLAPVLLPQRVHVREGVCEDLVARISCLTTHVGVEPGAFVGVFTGLSLLTDQDTRRLFPMVIHEAWRGRSDGGVTAVHLVGRDPLALMDVPHYRVFRDRSAIEVVCEVLDAWIARTPLGVALDYALPGLDLDRYPKRVNIVQLPHETDADFIRRLLRAEGVAWFWRPQAAHDPAIDGPLPRLELVMFDDSGVLPAAASPVVRYHRRDGTEESDTLDLLAERWELVPGGTTLASWDHEAARVDAGTGLADVADRHYGDAGRALARALDHVRVCAPHLGDSWDDLDRLAQARADHDSFRGHGFRGRGGDRTLAPGTWKRIEGYAPFEGRAPEDTRLVVTQVECFTENNLPAELHAPAQALMGDFGVPEWARVEATQRHVNPEQPFTCLFSAVPAGAPIRPAPPPPQRGEVLVGLVVNEDDDGELACDDLARVAVQLAGAEPGADTVTCQRMLTPWSGANHGLVAIPRAGTEVALLVQGHDRLLMLGAVPNGANPPARPSHRPALPANRSHTAIVSRELGTLRQQHLLFDDFPGRILAQLASEAGASSLTLGELAAPRTDGRAPPRGNGFELRTDDSGAVRTARSLLLTAWGRLDAAGGQLAADEHLALMQDCLDLFRALGRYAAQHQGPAPDEAPQSALLSDLKAAPAGSNVDPDGQGGAPTISLSAPAGIATSTPKTIVQYAGENIDAVAQRDLNLVAGQGFGVNAGKGIGLFAHQDGLRAIAHRGALLMQAQHGDIEANAANDFRLTASGNVFHVGKVITLVADDGSFIRIGDGGITLGSNGPITQKAASFPHSGPATMSADRPSFADGAAERKFVLRYGGPLGPIAANCAYLITLSDGSKVEGVTDAQGHTQLLQRDAMHIANVTFIDKPKA